MEIDQTPLRKMRIERIVKDFFRNQRNKPNANNVSSFSSEISNTKNDDVERLRVVPKKN